MMFSEISLTDPTSILYAGLIGLASVVGVLWRDKKKRDEATERELQACLEDREKLWTIIASDKGVSVAELKQNTAPATS